MQSVQIRISHISFRDGRPRFNPGPKLRKLKFQGQDLKHEDGRWFTAEEAALWVKDFLPEIERRRAAKRSGQRIIVKGRAVYRLADLVAAWIESPAFTAELEPKTQCFYRQMAGVLEKEAPALWNAAAGALTQTKAFNLYEQLVSSRGLATARAVIATASSAYSWGMKRGHVSIAVHPCQRLGMKGAEPRVRAGEIDEMRALVAAADACGRPEVGDMIVLALWSGQRQADRLELLETNHQDGRRFFRQAKTGAIVMVPDSPELAERIAAARIRRRSMTVHSPHVVVDETTGLPFTPERYRKAFAMVRAIAVDGIPDRLGATPSLADFRDQDLRDTAVTWLARAGATEGEIAAITGHSLANIKTVLKHYLAMHPELADSAIAKMAAWYEAKRQG